MISLLPCQKNKKDAEIAFSWRNDPATVASSYVPVLKTWDAFWMEYDELYFDIPGLKPCFIVKNDEKVGFVRFEETFLKEKSTEKGIEIILNIAPFYRRQGIGSATLSLLKEKFKKMGIKTLLADIRFENIASKKLFEKNGFVFLSERKEFVSKIQKKCHILRYYCTL